MAHQVSVADVTMEDKQDKDMPGHQAKMACQPDTGSSQGDETTVDTRTSTNADGNRSGTHADAFVGGPSNW